MSIANEIARLQSDSAAIASAITGKGVTVPAGSGFDDYATLIGQISGGSGVSYTPVEYIAFSGSQYIDSGITPNQSTHYDVTFMPTGGAAWKTLLSARMSSSSRRFELMLGTNTNANKELYFGYNTTSYNFNSSTALTDRLIQCIKDSNVLRVYENGVRLTELTAQAATFTAPVTLKIGCSDTNGTKANFYIGRLYRLEIGNTVFIPVRVNDVGALLNVTTKTILYNAGGGTISYGPDKS